VSEQTNHAILEIERQVFTLPIVEVYPALETCQEGLSQAEATHRLEQYGPNTLQEARRKPLIVKFLANFTHLMAILLWVGGIVALIAQMPQLAIAVWMVNVINGVFSFWQEFRAEKATEALRKLLPAYARVLREGSEQQILAQDLVPGDVVLLSEGDSISADCRLVQQAELQVDQSTLTGESRPVRKSIQPVSGEGITFTELPNLVFAGTHVVSGTAKAIVFTTGMNTEFGKIAHLTQSVGEELSPLQKEMNSVTRIVTVIAVLIGVLFFILATFVAKITLAESFIFALGMIVAFVPEGLLPTVTLALAMGTQRMARRNALIKKLSAVETLGCTTVICTDKTGTLTQNEMTVRSLWLPGRSDGRWNGRDLSATGIGYSPEGQIEEKSKALEVNRDEDLRRLLAVGAVCNNARLLAPEQSNGSGRWTILGDPTEAALKVSAMKGGLDLDVENQILPRAREIPFESRRKRMSTIHTVHPEEIGLALPVTAGDAPETSWRSTVNLAFVKGAPKEVLDLCDRVLYQGSEYPLDDGLRAQIMEANDRYARNGLRVLALAQRIVPNEQTDYSAEAVERDLTFIGLEAMMDPPRPEVAAAVEKCHHAGIRIVMITGDYGLTAESIARKIGIVQGDHPRIVTGFDLETMDEKALEEALAGEVIFARVAPEHKLRVVSALQALGQIVAVTGDGVNDSPALKKADIGVAMGISGSDVAKEAADMILTDDNFASIVNAVEEGRAVYANIKKFTTYIFTSNAPEAVPFILYAFSGARIPLALNVMHVLAIDLGTDITPALALGAEPPEPGVMDRPPRSLKEHVITRGLLARAYLILGPVEGLAAMAAFYFMYWTNGYWGKWIDLPAAGALYRGATGMALAAVVASQIGNLFAERSERIPFFKFPLFRNRMIWIGIATELLLVLGIVYVPFLQTFIGTGAFPLKNWLFLAVWIPALLLVDELRKIIVRRQDSKGVRR
jgi:magnesium-transporting ATPase (P-type)